MLLRRSASRFALCFSAAALLGAVPAYAQSVSGPADAARVQERLAQPGIREIPGDLVQVEGPAIASAPAGAEKVSLTLADLTLDGMSVYQTGEVAGLYSNRLGQKITVADIYQIAADLTRKYRNDGFILTQVVVPPQTIEGGHVKLQVVEGIISTVTVEGAESDRERRLIEAYANQVKGEPLNTLKLEQATLLINDLPGISARSIISPASQPGAANLRVLVTRKKYDAFVGLDNFGSRFLGPLEAQAGLSLNSPLGLNERISTDLIFAPSEEFGKELAYGDLVYLQPFGALGTSVELKAALASSDPGYTLEQFDVEGRSVTFSVKVNQPIVRTRASNFSTYVLFDARNNTTFSDIDVTRNDFIRAMRVGVDLDRVDRIFGGGFNTLNIEVAKGLNVFGASDRGDPRLTRAAGDPQFIKVNVEAQRLQRLGSNINLLAAFRGQMANDAQLSSEEFGVGGPQFGRGYDPSEVTGDDGIAGKLELQWNNPFPSTLVKTYQLYAFLDGGRVWNDDATTSSQKQMSVVSTGLGVRTTLRTNTEAGLYVALPLNRDVQTLGNEDPRVFFSAAQKF